MPAFTIVTTTATQDTEAVEVSLSIVRTFIRLREILSTNKALMHKLAALERKIDSHDEAIRDIVTAIRQMMSPPSKPARRIGFHP